LLIGVVLASVCPVLSAAPDLIRHTEIPFLKGVGSTSVIDLRVDLADFPSSANVYRVVLPQLTAQNVAAVSSKFGIAAKPVQRQDVFFSESSDVTLLVFRFSDSILYATNEWVSEVQPNSLPSTDESIRIAKRYLVAKGLTVDGMVASAVQPMTVAAYDESTGAETTYSHCNEVYFTYTIGAIPVVGPGAKIKVAVGEGGEILGVYRAWRRTTLLAPYSLMPATNALEYLRIIGVRSNLESPDRAIVEEISLGYYAIPGPEKQDYLEPVYVFKGSVVKGNENEGGSKESFVQYIPAVLEHAKEHAARALAIASGAQFAAQPTKVEPSGQLKAADGGKPAVGVEWVNEYHGYAPNLSNNDENTWGLYDWLGTKSWTKSFTWGDDNADEQDFKRAEAEGGGVDYDYADNVDLVMFSGHGSYNFFMFGHLHDDLYLTTSDAQWGGGTGGGDVEWLIIDACNVLYHSSSNPVWRWRNALQFYGAHYMLGFHTVAQDVADRGAYVGRCLTGYYGQSYKLIRNAWWYATTVTEGSSCICSYLRVAGSGYGAPAGWGWNTYYDVPHLYFFNSALGGYQETFDPWYGYTRTFYYSSWTC